MTFTQVLVTALGINAFLFAWLSSIWSMKGYLNLFIKMGLLFAAMVNFFLFFRLV